MSQIPVEDICELVSSLMQNFRASTDIKDIEDTLSRVECFHAYQRRKIDEGLGRIVELSRRVELESLEIHSSHDLQYQKELEDLENEKIMVTKAIQEQEELITDLEDKIIRINQQLDSSYENNRNQMPSTEELKLAIYEQLGIRILDNVSEDSCSLAIRSKDNEELLDHVSCIDLNLLESSQFDIVQRIWDLCSG